MKYETKQKDQIKQYFINNSDKIVTIKELLSLNVSKATLYRNLEELIGENVILKYYNDSSKSYDYQYNSMKKHCNEHLHMMCDDCKKIIHLTNFTSNNDVKINFSSSLLHGICSQCNMRK